MRCCQILRPCAYLAHEPATDEAGELADGCQRLGSCSEVQAFRVEAGVGYSSNAFPRVKRRFVDPPRT